MEQVNHPSHYKIPGRKECIIEMQERFGTYQTFIFCLMNAYKYLYRAGLKDNVPEEQDIQKARWYHDYAMTIGDGLMFSNSEMKLLHYIRRELKKYD